MVHVSMLLCNGTGTPAALNLGCHGNGSLASYLMIATLACRTICTLPFSYLVPSLLTAMDIENLVPWIIYILDGQRNGNFVWRKLTRTFVPACLPLVPDETP
ncbi:hypothetical protein D5086_020852 [Populus alba]|uniref:Uncharacterized protein n=1 Tax=Populus alba TaxID=43335 RepID=A0ACC4BMU6_POPAL